MELNVQLISSRESLKKNKLYQVSVDDPVITWKEEHEDSEPEIVDLAFHIPQRLEEKMQGAVCSSNRDLGMIGQKYHIATAGIRKDIEIVKDFRNKKITVLNMKLNLQVHLLEYSAKKTRVLCED